ncbi:MAG: protein kinase/lanthionine synthetase C family protein, partial [Actinomycetota bacterium]|nr:protein kinase/lanthionine synthetase C family protein [Actinomycetota bacterium]
RETGQLVVMKEARPHVELGGGRGGYVTRLLRQEARVLAAVGHLRRSPQLLDVFEQQGHLFLVLEHLDGVPLRRHLRLRREMPPLTGDDLRAMIRVLAGTMATFHAAGVLLRDFTPNNLLVMPGGDLRVVDLEFSHLLGDGPPPRWREGTLVYVSPQQLRGEPSGLPDDYHSLGATIAHVATGVDPCFFPDWDGRPLARLDEWLGVLEQQGIIEGAISDIVLGCTAEDPNMRWSPEQVLDRIDRPPSADPRRAPAPPDRDQPQLAVVVADIARWLVSNVREDGEWLWPTSRDGMRLDPCNVQTGASGVGLFLCQVGRSSGDPAVRDLAGRAGHWVARQVSNGPPRPPGLYFGRAGALWFLDEAAGWLGDPVLRDRAGELALSLPTSSFNPDITHGTAGLGLAQLHRWQATGDSRCLERAERAVAALSAEAQPGPDGVVWRVREDVRSAFAGLASYGFAHGNAGIAYFLLSAACVLADPRCRELALEAVETLVRAARLDEEGAAWWEVGPGRGGARSPHWCNGSSGIGTTLVRAYIATTDERYLRLAEASARAVVGSAWRGGLVQCHGLAGDGDFLLDLHAVTREPRFRELALELAALIYLRRFRDEGLLVFPDESGERVTASFGTGLAGVGSFFARLAHGGLRMLMVDELLEPPRPAQPAREALPQAVAT